MKLFLAMRSTSGLSRQQIAILVPQGQDAAWLGADDRHTLARIGHQRRDILLRQLACSLDQPLREHGPSATGMSLDDLHRVTGRFQQFNRRLADLRIVVVDEGVVDSRPPARSCRRA